MPSGSAAEDAIDADRDDRADRDGDDVEVARLVVGIECREEGEAENGAGDGAREHFREYE